MKSINHYILEKFKITKKNYSNIDSQELIKFFHSYNNTNLDKYIDKWINKYNPVSFTFYFPEDIQRKFFLRKINNLKLNFENSSLLIAEDFLKKETEVLDSSLNIKNARDIRKLERDNCIFSSNGLGLYIGKNQEKGIVVNDNMDYWVVIYID